MALRFEPSMFFIKGKVSFLVMKPRIPQRHTVARKPEETCKHGRLLCEQKHWDKPR